MNNTAIRILVSFFAIPLMLFLSYKGGYYFSVFTVIIAALCLYEFYSLFGHKGFYVLKIPGLIYSSALIISWVYFREYFAYLLCSSVLFFLIEALRKERRNIYNPSIAIAGLVYISLPFALLSGLDRDYRIVFLLFMLVWVLDSSAYFGGKFFGKHRLSSISPKKTIEGAVFGFVFTVITAVIFYFSTDNLITLGESVIIGVLAGIFGQAGDLFESYLKRATGVKDSSGIIPGHGGMLDRFDSLIFITPVIYVYLNIIRNL